MFSGSTQRKHWIFKDENELSNLRTEANKQFIAEHSRGMSNDDRSRNFLSAADEKILCRQYEFFLKEFCRKFQPPMPKSVIGTSFNYFKRFYLLKSVMDFHPKEILVTCVYLACKVEEFNVSITQFVANVKGDREKAIDIILNNELLLLRHLNFHLTIHNPYRPIEGFLIDIKARCPAIKDVERLRPLIDDFLDRCLFTDAFLLHAPSQIALTAILFAAGKLHENFDSYVTDVLIGIATKDRLPKLIESIRSIRSIVKAVEPPPRDQVKAIEKMLDRCRNQENNPDSDAYKRKMQDMIDDAEDSSSKKYARMTEEQRVTEEELLGIRN